MTPPKCNICHHLHWKNEPHVLPKPKKAKKRDRRKYQRELMRQRRAKARAPNVGDVANIGASGDVAS